MFKNTKQSKVKVDIRVVETNSIDIPIPPQSFHFERDGVTVDITAKAFRFEMVETPSASPDRKETDPDAVLHRLNIALVGDYTSNLNVEEYPNASAKDTELISWNTKMIWSELENGGQERVLQLQEPFTLDGNRNKPLCREFKQKEPLSGILVETVHKSVTKYNAKGDPYKGSETYHNPVTEMTDMASILKNNIIPSALDVPEILEHCKKMRVFPGKKDRYNNQKAERTDGKAMQVLNDSETSTTDPRNADTSLDKELDALAQTTE